MKNFTILLIYLLECAFLVLDLIVYAYLLILTNYDSFFGLEEDSDEEDH